MHPGSQSVAPTDVVARALGAELAAARARRGDVALRVLDVGGGSGSWAVPLAHDGACRVTVVDPSANALAMLHRRARDAGVAELVQGVQGDVDRLEDVVAGGESDLVLAHGLLEYVDDPAAAVRSLSTVVAPAGAVSVLVAGRFAALLARVVAGRIGEARRLLEDPDGRWGPDDPLRRRMDVDQLRALLEDEGRLTVERVQGHRALGDLVPAPVAEAGGGCADELAALEDVAGATPPLRDLAPLLHVLARRAG